MIKRTITETICEYDQEGKLIKKTVTETHEEEDNTSITYSPTIPNEWWYQPYVYNNGTGTATTTTQKMNSNDSVLTNTTTISDKITD